MFKAFETKEAQIAGRRLAEYIHGQASAELITYLNLDKEARQNATIQRFMRLAIAQAKALRLNILKRTALLSAFKLTLEAKGLSGKAINSLMKLLDKTIYAANNAVNDAVGRPPSAGDLSFDLDKIDYQDLLKVQGLIETRQYVVAAELLSRFVRLDPNNANLAVNYGAVLLDLGRVAEGRRELERAIALQPGLAPAYINLGSLFLWQGALDSAEQVLRRAVRLDAASAKTLALLGATLYQKGELRQAEKLLRKALERDAKSSLALTALGSIYAAKGDKSEAMAFYDQALSADSGNIDALIGTLGLNVSAENNKKAYERIHKALQNGVSLAAEISLRYALGDYLDRTGSHSEAFSNYKKANEFKKRFVAPYDPVAHSERVNQIIRTYDKDTIKRRLSKASDSKTPVFVVGMMRSGTTLVEQIIASHPNASGAGELDYWHKVILNEDQLLQMAPPDNRRAKKLAEAYLKVLKRHSADAERVVDKSTFNLDYLGLIHRVFPEAKILYLKRNAIDTCLSCYFQNFINGAAFALDLEHLAHYYKEHIKLVSHWRAVLPADSLLEVSYEGLVSDPESWSRRIIAFLGLDWDDCVLQYYKTKRIVRTASMWQVREKISNKSVGRWKAYKRWVGPLLELAD